MAKIYHKGKYYGGGGGYEPDGTSIGLDDDTLTLLDVSDGTVDTLDTISADAEITAGSPLRTIIALIKYKLANINVGVTSFNSRTGAVNPASGDYTSSQVTHGSSNVSTYLGIWTSAVSCLTGDTSVTISNTAIHTTSTIKAFSETSSGKPVGYSSIVVSEGKAVVTFASALTEAAKIRLQILNI